MRAGGPALDDLADGGGRHRDDAFALGGNRIAERGIDRRPPGSLNDCCFHQTGFLRIIMC